jgi:hypothetical protein
MYSRSDEAVTLAASDHRSHASISSVVATVSINHASFFQDAYNIGINRLSQLLTTGASDSRGSSASISLDFDDRSLKVLTFATAHQTRNDHYTNCCPSFEERICTG